MQPFRWAIAAALTATMATSQAGPSTPTVVRVQPSGAQVPENLLRISIELAAPVEQPLLPRIALLRADGELIQEPFLEQELWSPSGKLLTVLLHPGRVKSGLKAREEKGPILSVGDNVSLVLDGRLIKRWSVGPADTTGPVVAAWKVLPVDGVSKQSLIVKLDGPIDGRDAGHIAVSDMRNRRVSGRAQLKNNEGTWTFTPDAPWRVGEYKLVARATLEDPAGNRLGGHVETPIDAPREAAADTVLLFSVVPRPSVRGVTQ